MRKTLLTFAALLSGSVLAGAIPRPIQAQAVAPRDNRDWVHNCRSIYNKIPDNKGRSLDFALRSVGGPPGEAQSMMERLCDASFNDPGLLRREGVKEGTTHPADALLQIGDHIRELTNTSGSGQ